MHLGSHARLFIRIAGVSGALAVALSAYGAHGSFSKDEHRAKVFDVANKQHFFHTLALLGVSQCRKPLLVGSLLTSGMLIFCGSCYYQAITDDSSIKKITPYGGMMLIAGWLALII